MVVLLAIAAMAVTSDASYGVDVILGLSSDNFNQISLTASIEILQAKLMREILFSRTYTHEEISLLSTRLLGELLLVV